MTAPLTYAQWIAVNPPPDLHDLLRAHGSYSAVPRDEWNAYLAAVKAWQARRRDMMRDRY